MWYHFSNQPQLKNKQHIVNTNTNQHNNSQETIQIPEVHVIKFYWTLTTKKEMTYQKYQFQST